MKTFLQGFVVLAVMIITAIVTLPLVPLWAFAMWFSGEDEFVDAWNDAIREYLEIIRIA